MADTQVPNFALRSTTSAFDAVWEWTRTIKAAGGKYLASSDGTAKDTTGTASNDKWGGGGAPLSDVYPTALDGVVAWWAAELAAREKLLITAAPTGTFVKGEKVTQATSGAEGEFWGYTYDAGSTTGHVCIIPRTGTFDGSHTVTGATSGATFTPTVRDRYALQVVVTKAANLTQGSIYLQMVSSINESASQFVTLATAAGCTATVAPGGGGTGNAFPSVGSWVGCGTQTGTPAHTAWFQSSTNLGKAQIVATNMTGATGVSGDGTTWIVIGDTNNGAATGTEMFGLFLCDNGEPADLCPFVWFKSSSVLASNANARLDASGTALLSVAALNTGLNTGSSMYWRSWRRRGFPSADAFNSYAPTFLAAASTIVLADNVATPETVACSYASSPEVVREHPMLVSQDDTKKGRKGSPRWLMGQQGHTAYDTMDTKKWVGFLAPAGSGSFTNITFFVGPWDGSTVPLQA